MTTRLPHSTARATAEVFGVPHTFADDDELVTHPEVDAVAITVKVPEHDRLIRAVLAAGKHVFSEWPLGVGLGQAAALADLARASGVHHIVGKPDGSAADLPVPGRFSPVPAAVPAGPPRNVAVLYREFARAISDGLPAAPDFATAARFHQLLENIQRASDTGIRQDVVS